MTREEAINKLEYLINSPVGREEIDETCYEVMKYLSAQKPRIVTEADFENADEDGFIPAWCEEKAAGEVYCECIPIGALEDAKFGRVRWWTSRPDQATREATPWN